MHIPQTTTPIASVTPISSLDAVLHGFVGVSWHVLMPYTILGAGLMAYSQARLIQGQHALNRQAEKPPKQRKISKRPHIGWPTRNRLVPIENAN